MVTLSDQVENEPDFLPTPTASVSSDGLTVETAQRRAIARPGKENLVEAALLLPTAYLPTPTVDDANNVDRVSGTFQSLTRSVQESLLLPTPSTQNSHGNRVNNRGEMLLPGAVESMLPTPTGSDAHASGGSTPKDVTLTDAVVRTELGTIPNERHLLPTPVTDPLSGNGHARDLGSEVLLPTPAASLQNYDDDPERWEARRAESQDRHRNGNGMGKPLGIAAQEIVMLPTPIESEGRKAGVQNSNDRLKTGQVFLSNIIQDVEEQTDRFLPTPTVRDYKDTGDFTVHEDKIKLAHSVQAATADGAAVTNWGKYAAAIERTEQMTGIAAPAPTLPDGRDGKRRLAAAFVEWMMLLEPGTVCGQGLSRTQELSRLGNGVVPVQAGVAVSMLIRRLAIAKARGEL